MKAITAICLLALLAGCSSTGNESYRLSDNQANDSVNQLSLVPYPASLEQQDGQLALGHYIRVRADRGSETALAALRELLADLEMTDEVNSAQTIRLILMEEEAEGLGKEGYKLTIDDNVVISANTDSGLFYGVQTLRQLLPATAADNYLLPRIVIEDSPQYAWRGSMIDVARSFLPISYLKSHIDRMARFKLNKLHLHLSDDQGWRVEIKQYPGLTAVGGASAVEGGQPGFYTQDELRDLVNYAASRNVVVIPEIDLPGHTQAALASYNELACDDVDNLEPYSRLEVGFSKLCLTKPEVIYPFVRNVLREITEVFPSEYIHIGGDEIKDPLYGEFIGRTVKIVNELGRSAVAWEEASVADLSRGTLLQLWNDDYDIQPALDQGIRLILSPCSYSYFDHGNYSGQPNTYDWCRAEGVPLERAYQLQPEDYSQVAGVESAMWTELVHSNEAADNRLWPRLAATAELAWSQADNRDYSEFLHRLSQLKHHFDAMGIGYHPEPHLNW